MADVKAATLAGVAGKRWLEGRVTETTGRSGQADMVRQVLPITEYNGVKTVLPPGMDERKFADVMAALPPKRLEGARGGRTPDHSRGGGVRRVHAAVGGPGRYVMQPRGTTCSTAPPAGRSGLT